jgi:D-threo-aldose 1-dehydrogenase
MTNRREFLTITGGSILASGLSLDSAKAAEGINNQNENQPSAPIPEAANGQGHFKLDHRFGLGGVAIGDGMNVNSDEDCRAALQAAWDAGVRLYDTSPWYGFGLSERRFGNFLYNKKREDFILSTKVGRVFHADATFRLKTNDPLWFGTPNFNYRYDFSASGVRRSVEDSLQRLGLPYIDMVYIHDLDSHNKDINWEERFEECKRGAFPELIRMRDEGIIRGWGLGVNDIDPILRTIRESDPNIHLSAEQYSLILHEDAVERLLPVAEEKGNQIVLGGTLNTGYLAGSPRYYYRQSQVTPQIAAKRDQLREVAARHGVDLRTAALQFALAGRAVTAIAVGAHNAQQVQQNVASLSVQIPEAFWAELRERRLISPNARTGYQQVTLRA